MSSYFDHFILLKVINPIITDSFFIIILVILLYYLINFNYLISNRLQVLLKLIINHWLTIIDENLKNNSKFFILPLLTLFMLIFGLNLFGFFQYTFPTTTHLTITFILSISSWLSVIVYGFIKFKDLLFSMFMPTGAPIILSPLLVIIEIISNLSRPVALGMRLAANLTAGHLLLSILGDFGCKILLFNSISNLFIIFIIIFIITLEIGVLVIQAYVFCLLLMIYLKDSIELH